MDPIDSRRTLLRGKIENISSNRERFEYLNNYYLGKTAIVIATGPGFKDYTNFIKENTNENTIIICIKQSLKALDYSADFHLLNRVHLEEYFNVSV
jgi:hypothetical protein